MMVVVGGLFLMCFAWTREDGWYCAGLAVDFLDGVSFTLTGLSCWSRHGDCGRVSTLTRKGKATNLPGI